MREAFQENGPARMNCACGPRSALWGTPYNVPGHEAPEKQRVRALCSERVPERAFRGLRSDCPPKSKNDAPQMARDGSQEAPWNQLRANVGQVGAKVRPRQALRSQLYDDRTRPKPGNPNEMPETAKQSQNQINVASYGALTGDGQGGACPPPF